MTIKTNDLAMIVHYFKVKHSGYSRTGERQLGVYDVDREYPFNIIGEELVNSAVSADQYDKEEKTTKTKIAEKLINAGHKPFTVSFIKQDGSNRVLRGRLIAPEPMLGRSRVDDLDEVDKKKRLKQVDHRTIKWLILDGVKWVVK